MRNSDSNFYTGLREGDESDQLRVDLVRSEISSPSLLPENLFYVSHFALNLAAHFFGCALILQIGIANDLPSHLLDLTFDFVNCAFNFVGVARFHANNSYPVVAVVVPVFMNISAGQPHAARHRQHEISNRLNPLPQRFEIVIIECHHAILRLQFECGVQRRFGLFQIPPTGRCSTPDCSEKSRHSAGAQPV